MPRGHLGVPFYYYIFIILLGVQGQANWHVGIISFTYSIWNWNLIQKPTSKWKSSEKNSIGEISFPASKDLTTQLQKWIWSFDWKESIDYEIVKVIVFLGLATSASS